MKRVIQIIIAFVFHYSLNGLSVYAQEPGDYFKIRVVDELTGRGVPLVELKSTNNIRYYTDNNGIIAFYEPGLMDQEVFFHIKSHGYTYPEDGFGYRGKTLMTKKGDSALIKIERINISERLYRITGQGLYHHSLLVGHPVPLKNPKINGKVTGQDTFIETLYKGKLYWFWGDSDRPSYPLGNFSTSGATSELPGQGGLDQGVGIDFTYFIDSSGFSKPMCPIPGPGPVWIHWLVNIKDEEDTEHLVCSYSRIKTLDEAYERGIAIFDDSAKIFKPVIQFDPNTPLFPDGHPLRVMLNDTEYLYFSFVTPYTLRVRAHLDHITNPEAYEAFTCLEKGKPYEGLSSNLDRSSKGRLNYSWKANTEPINYYQQSELIETGKIKPEEGWQYLQGFEEGTSIQSHAGSVSWNEFRKRWIMIFHQRGGTSNLGEVWYAEGDTPTGPWVYARKIVTHNNYSFYNVGQHPIFDQDEGRIVYFEGTYTNTFSTSPYPTPRYNYNQIMYRLDLNDPRIYLPVPVYLTKNVEGQAAYLLRESIDSLNIWNKIDKIPFFAIPPNRAFDGLVAVHRGMDHGKIRLHIKSSSETKDSHNPLFYGLPVFETKEEKLIGRWQCVADGYPLQMDIMMTENEMNASFKEKNILVTEIHFANDTIVLNVKESLEEVDYRITASVQEGKMNGNIVAVLTGETSLWEGECIDFFRKLSKSPAVVPLYEYQIENGTYYYSTDPDLPKMKRSEKPICNVWRNPATTLALDFEAKPVKLKK